jgi:hypothetical protein
VNGAFQKQKEGAKIEELQKNCKIKNIRNFYRSIKDFKKGLPT